MGQAARLGVIKKRTRKKLVAAAERHAATVVQRHWRGGAVRLARAAAVSEASLAAEELKHEQVRAASAVGPRSR